MTDNNRRRPLYVLYGATLISVTGDAMGALAIPWFVLQTTGSASQTGIAAFFSIVPVVLGTFFGGTWVDRIGYKRTSVAADIASGSTILLIPLLYTVVGIEFWQLLLLLFFTNLLDAPGGAARRAMIPELATHAGITLDRAAAFEDAVSRATGLIGALLAGVLIGVIGSINVLWLDGLTFFISALSIQFLIPSDLVTLAPKDGEQSYLQDLLAGFRYIRGDGLFQLFVTFVMVTNMIDAAVYSVTLPIYTEQRYGSALSLGLILAVFGASAVAGTLLYSWIGERFSRRWMFTTAFFLVSLRMVVFAAFPPFGVLLVLMALLGLAVGPINPILITVSYERIPDYMRARVLGFLSAGVQVAMPVGVLTAGFLLEATGLRNVLLIYAAGYIGATVAISVNPHMAGLDKPLDPASCRDDRRVDKLSLTQT